MFAVIPAVSEMHAPTTNILFKRLSCLKRAKYSYTWRPSTVKSEQLNHLRVGTTTAVSERPIVDRTGESRAAYEQRRRALVRKSRYAREPRSASSCGWGTQVDSPDSRVIGQDRSIGPADQKGASKHERGRGV